MSTETKKDHRRDWIIFWFSLAVTLFLLVFYATWFWVTLPFVLTFFVRAIDYI